MECIHRNASIQLRRFCAQLKAELQQMKSEIYKRGAESEHKSCLAAFGRNVIWALTDPTFLWKNRTEKYLHKSLDVSFTWEIALGEAVLRRQLGASSSSSLKHLPAASRELPVCRTAAHQRCLKETDFKTFSLKKIILVKWSVTCLLTLATYRLLGQWQLFNWRRWLLVPALLVLSGRRCFPTG